MDQERTGRCQAAWLGLVDFDAAWQLQDRLAAQVAARERPPLLLLLEHPHTYTFGRRGHGENLRWSEAELQQRGVTLRWIDRGGDITYHGPGQLVGYPLLPLAPAGWSAERLPQADYVGYLRQLEEVLILTLAGLGVVTGRREGHTGVWVMADVWGRCLRCDPHVKPQPAKIASIGVKVDARGISRHGFALNINPEREYWEGIHPCGLQGVTMADLADFFDPPPAVEEVARKTADVFARVFDLQLDWVDKVE